MAGKKPKAKRKPQVITDWAPIEDDVRRDYCSGTATVKEIADKYNIPINAIKYRARTRGWRLLVRQADPDQPATASVSYDGESITDIALPESVTTQSTSRTTQRIARNVSLAQDYILGSSRSDIANKYNLSERQVANILSTDEAVKCIIDGMVKRNVAGLVQAVNEHDKMISSDETDSAVKLRAIDLRYQVTGVKPSHTHSATIHQIYNDNRVTINESGGALADYARFKLLGGLDAGGDVIDGEIVDSEAPAAAEEA